MQRSGVNVVAVTAVDALDTDGLELEALLPHPASTDPQSNTKPSQTEIHPSAHHASSSSIRVTKA